MSKYPITKSQLTVIKEQKSFYSLRWKLLFGSSLILLAIVVVFSAISYWGLMQSFDNQRQIDHKRFSREIDNLIDNTTQNLDRLAEIIPFLNGMRSALLVNDSEHISKAFDQHWSLLQFHNDVEFVYFFNDKNQFVAGWDNAGYADIKTETLLNWVVHVNQFEQPINPLSCQENCIQFTIAPLLVDGRKVGTVVLGISLVDVLVSFKRIFGADIGLLIKQQKAFTAQEDSKVINNWDVYISALTNPDGNSQFNYQILDRASEVYENIKVLEEGVQISGNNLHHQLELFLLNSVEADSASLVVITDVTAAVRNIRNAIWNIGLTGLLGLIISQLLLFLILTRMLSRLKDVAIALPLLASGQFESFRQSLFVSELIRNSRDEVDTLSEAAITLSHQLEKLELRISSRTKMLIEQRDELSRERDFVKNLLDTAQAIVLTQNSAGRIITLNGYGEMLTRYTEAELLGKSFLGTLIPEYDSEDAVSRFAEIHSGQKMQLRHEAITYCKDGSKRHVAWLHSHLSWNSEEDPSILSVGLDVTEYKRVEGHLAWLADHDPLTNMLNRRRFSEELEQVLHRSERYLHPGALLFFDLDRFKYINDVSGHQAGDSLLKMVATMLAKTTRTGDITGRLGGDEFAIILPEINAEGAIEVAKKVLNQLNQAQLTINGRTHKISASIGIALFPQHGGNIQDLLAAADLAMYQAKAIGRNAWYLFSDDDRIRDRIQLLVDWKERIEYAQTHDNFMLYLQPIMHIKTKRISHYEVLIRMQDKDGTIRSPGDFIPAAENTGLIHAIDHMVLRKAIAQAAIIYEAGIFASFSINLSAHAFNDPELMPILKQQLAEYHIDPENLMFEITETAALEDIPGARTLMKEIKELGCGFVLDDFGVGFSSFFYLRELPVDAVKIDGSFIKNLANNSDDVILVNALCSVARGFGKRVTAEFVESEKILEIIEQMDIDYAQGYYIGRPSPIEQFLTERIGFNDLSSK